MRCILACAGLGQAAALAWPFAGDAQGQPQGWLQLVALGVLAFYLDRVKTTKQAFSTVWTFASFWLIGSVWWLYISMHVYGGMPSWLAGMAVVLLASSMALLYAIPGVIYHLATNTQVPRGWRAVAFGAVWLISEWLRGTVFTGLPWGAVGYAHTDSLLATLSSWIGVYGISGVAAMGVMWMVAQVRVEQHKSISWLPAIVMCSVAGFVVVMWVMPKQAQLSTVKNKPIRVALVQGNIEQNLKFSEGIENSLRDYQKALVENQADLIVTPETSLPITQDQLPQGYVDKLQDKYKSGQQLAMIGMPLVNVNAHGQKTYTNSVIGLGQINGGETYRYDKHHLVPFGEFVPPMFQWFVRLMNIPMGSFERGALPQSLLVWRSERIAANICYEDLFGEELAQSFGTAEKPPTLMVNLSNIAWFGDTIAIDQHLQISRMRAMELGRPMLRSTNTGATVVIDEHGKVTARLPSGVKGILQAEVSGVDGPITPYARWVSVWGLWPMIGLALGCLLWVAKITYQLRHGRRRFGP
jgi:apolipoprotein N-acyltransferase